MPAAKCAGAGLLLLLALPPLQGAQPGLRAGAARVDITPDGPIWMAGYASRTHPSTGVLQPLSAKALAIEDSKGGRIVIVTTDLVGLPRSVTDVAAARILKEHGLDRSRLVFNSSHTHTGPLVRGNLITMFDLTAEERAKVDQYGSTLTGRLVEVVAAAIQDLSPATLDYGFGEAGFAMNRRQFTANGVKIGVNPQGPTDHSVPVIRVRAADGRLRAVLFAYACHNTTLTGEFYEISGDYAGFAQSAIEEAHPGITALFLMLCGGDQNPEPRSTVALARQHGSALAHEVDRVLDEKLTPMKGPIRAAQPGAVRERPVKPECLGGAPGQGDAEDLRRPAVGAPHALSGAGDPLRPRSHAARAGRRGGGRLRCAGET
jgi:hypothetical protein